MTENRLVGNVSVGQMIQVLLDLSSPPAAVFDEKRELPLEGDGVAFVRCFRGLTRTPPTIIMTETAKERWLEQSGTTLSYSGKHV